MATTSFILSAVLVAMACVKASRVRAWRTSINPSAPEVTDSSFVVARILLLVMAVLGVYTGFHSLAVADNGSWSDAELTSAVKGATRDLNGSFEYGDPYDDGTAPADFDGEYATKLEDEIIEHGGGDAPQYGVDASLTGPTTATEATYRITAGGAAKAFCMHVTRAHTDDVESVAPGLPGDAAKVTMPEYTYAVSSRAGEC
ncbi:hypothetical protein ABZ484_28390 [Streptomyces sp. NPDC006393]|uniref:hypothetical protein n=1 Tax=Streptomyces sp. NPDC006393 TaxID=3156763 RepID=UPI0034079290